MSSGWQRRIRTCASELAAVRAVLPAPTCVLGKRGAGRLLLDTYWDWNAGAALYFRGCTGGHIGFSPSRAEPLPDGRGSVSAGWGALECGVHGA